MSISIYEWSNLSKIKSSCIKFVNFIFITILFLIMHFNISLEYSLFAIILHVLSISIIEILNFNHKSLFNISSSSLGVIWVGLFIGCMIPIRNLSSGGFELTLMYHRHELQTLHDHNRNTHWKNRSIILHYHYFYKPF